MIFAKQNAKCKSQKTTQKQAKKKKSKTKPKKVQCVMCDKYTSKKTSLTPASCFAKTMDKSHRVYQKCWWDPKKSFALETNSHKCMGCQKTCHLIKVLYYQL